jgi:hypothetical protein
MRLSASSNSGKKHGETNSLGNLTNNHHKERITQCVSVLGHANRITRKRGSIMVIKLLKKGIKIDGKYFPCFYSSSRNNIEGNATIYIRSYDPLPSEAYQVLKIENETNMQTDYFEKDRIRISKNSPYFAQVELLANN